MCDGTGFDACEHFDGKTCRDPDQYPDYEADEDVCFTTSELVERYLAHEDEILREANEEEMEKEYQEFRRKRK